jgi:hypothetical protein
MNPDVETAHAGERNPDVDTAHAGERNPDVDMSLTVRELPLAVADFGPFTPFTFTSEKESDNG